MVGTKEAPVAWADPLALNHFFLMSHALTFLKLLSLPALTFINRRN